MKIEKLQRILSAEGALPFQAIQALQDHGFIKHSKHTPGPSSLDLALSDECYRIDRIIIPKPGESVRDLIPEMIGKRQLSPTLKKDETYLIQLKEGFYLPDSVYGFCNPKSSTGRIFTHSRILADGVSQYDSLSRGYTGELWNVLQPKAFSVSYAPGDTASQIRILTSDTRLSELEINSLHVKAPLVKDEYGQPLFGKQLQIGGGDHGYLTLSIDCVGVGDIIGYEAVSCPKVVPLSGKQLFSKGKFWKPIKKAEHIELEPGKQYILSTKERVSIPPNHAAEVKAIDERFGEFRSHYAGFIDNGFGYDPNRPLFGNTITLEVCVFERMCLWHGQPVVCLYFEKMAALPKALYATTSGTYQNQTGARLSKQFIM